MTGNEHELKDVTYPSPPLSRSSLDSNESLRALEVTDGLGSGRRPTRSYSVSGFQFEDDLLPLTLSEAAQPGREQVPKNVGIIKGTVI
jgi:hypothetical protein